MKRPSQDPENAGLVTEVITDPLELVNEFNNTNRMGCRVTSLGDGLLSYTVPVVGGLFAESYEEVGEEFTKLHELSNIRYTLDMNIIEEYKKGEYTYEVAEGAHVLSDEDIEYAEENSEEADFDVDDLDYYEVYR